MNDATQTDGAVQVLSHAHWDADASAAEQDRAIDALERGQVLWLPRLPFTLSEDERALCTPGIAAQAKNVSLAPGGELPRGSSASPAQQQLLLAMMQRYAASSRALIEHLLPHYRSALQQARTSFRPLEIEGRGSSWRKDDTRLHVDSFPSSPTGGDRILRVFSNVNPQGAARHWRLGEPFDRVAQRYAAELKPPLPGSSALLHALGITKRRRSAYDHFMLQLHDRMKADADYQAQVAQQSFDFSAGSTWIVYTDQASHAAMRGQYAFEQTFHLPVRAMARPERAPLRVLERLLGHALA